MSVRTIVIGSLNTDLVATGLRHIPKPGEHAYGNTLHVGPGGKSRNIADMLARLVPKESVAMVGRTVEDSYGLWRQPLEALEKAGVNTGYVRLEPNDGSSLPAIALIAVDEQGNNQIIVLPGASERFCKEDIAAAADLFETVSDNNGALVLTLECPLDTAIYAVEQANQHGLKVLFDPGGLQANMDVQKLTSAGIFLIKPNEHEAQMLTGVVVTDFKSAQRAATKLLEHGVKNVLITVGAKGAYLFNHETAAHIPVTQVHSGSDEKDETGCGDQTMAALCAFIQEGEPLQHAAEKAILAGTLQFHRIGIQPVSKEELTK